MSGYSYTTITMEPDQAPRVAMHLYPDQHARMTYFPATDTPAAFILIEHAKAHLSIGTTSDTTITDAHVQFARDLYGAAAQFLADCERLRDDHATQTDQHDTSANQGAAA
ncbi:hypothetical protein [Sphaerisporangium aureirubrum]|uniref:DUF3077 domain-containing protein n=1 Tax=Sphaerisporangium aureirubrum TaxID=1544736 RepID=A0ABW1NSV3_9ACTN